MRRAINPCENGSGPKTKAGVAVGSGVLVGVTVGVGTWVGVGVANAEHAASSALVRRKTTNWYRIISRIVTRKPKNVKRWDGA